MLPLNSIKELHFLHAGINKYERQFISVYLISWIRQSLTMVDLYMVMTQGPDLYIMRLVISVKIWIVFTQIMFGIGCF